MYKDCKVYLINSGIDAVVGDITSYPLGLAIALFQPKNNEKAYNLYVTVEDKINVGDWCLHAMGDVANNDHKLIQATVSNVESIQEWWNKVIASSDKSLGYPILSDDFVETFIRSYVKDNNIISMKIQYERWITNLGRPFVVSDDYPITQRIYEEGTGLRVVVNIDGTVNLKEVDDYLLLIEGKIIKTGDKADIRRAYNKALCMYNDGNSDMMPIMAKIIKTPNK